MNGTPDSQFTGQTRVMREITPEWQRLMRAAELIKRGEARVIFNEGRPVQLDIAVKKVRLDIDEDFEGKFKTIKLL